MLDESLIGSGDRQARRRKCLILPLSLLAHALAIAAMVVVPLLFASSQLPDVKVTNILVLAPPLPLPPPPPPPPLGSRRGSRAPKAAPGKNEAKPPVIFGRLIAPIEVPVTLEEETGDFGVEGGVPWGVVGGVEGGVEGGVVGGVLGGVLGGTMPDELPVFVSGKSVPKLIKEIRPEFPREAFAARLQAILIVEAQTDIYGRVRRARIIRGHPVFNEAALAAVRQWLYEPYIVEGIPRPIRFTVTITFGLTSR